TKRNPGDRADETARRSETHVEIAHLKKIGHAASPIACRGPGSASCGLIPRACKLTEVAALNDSPRLSAALADARTSSSKPSIRLSARRVDEPERSSSCIHPPRPSRRVE